MAEPLGGEGVPVSTSSAPATGVEDATNPTALLLGSYKFEKSRPIRNMADKTNIVEKVKGKGGRKKVFTKTGKVPDEAWVQGDLENMEEYVKKEQMHWCGTLDYRERDETSGRYQDGKRDILTAVRNFFAQDDRSEFILYFTGHGDKNGSWCIPVTELKHPKPQRSVEDDEGNEDANYDPEHRGVRSLSPKKSIEIEQQEDDSIVRRRTPSPVTKPRSASLYSRSSRASTRSEVPATNLYFDLISYDDIVAIWDEEKKGRQRKLMMILDCCHSGRWVQMVNGECRHPPPKEMQGPLPDLLEESITASAASADRDEGVRKQENEANLEPTKREEERPFYEKRDDICIQAACRPVEESMISSNQLSSFFTRAFITAQSRTTLKKMCITFFDHFFVLGLPSFLLYSHSFVPMKSEVAPFAGIKFFDSFDDMHLQTT